MRDFTHQLLWESLASVALVTLLLYPGLFQPAITRGTPGDWSQRHAAALWSLASALLLNSDDLCLDQSNFRQTQSAVPSQFSKALIAKANILLDYGFTLYIHDNLSTTELLKFCPKSLNHSI